MNTFTQTFEDVYPLRGNRPEGEPVSSLVGKTVVETAYDPLNDHPDGALVVRFTDGTRLWVSGIWCNDGTADTYAVVLAP